MTTSYGLRLKKAYKHAGLTQAQLASTVGVSQAAISDACQIAHGSAYTIQMALACGVDPLWLATGEGEMQPTTPSKEALHIARELDRKRSPEHQEWLHAMVTQLLNFPKQDAAPPQQKLKNI